MNICHEGGSIVPFTESRAAQRDEADLPTPVDEWVDYCRARESAERAAAKNSNSIVARRIHQELAQAYAQLIKRNYGSAHE